MCAVSFAEITHGIDGMKIDGQIRVADKPGKPEMETISTFPTDVTIVQAHQVGHVHPCGEMAFSVRASDASVLEEGISASADVSISTAVENQGFHPCYPGIEQATYSTEILPQQYMQFPYQWPLITGYPALVVDSNGYYYTYPSESDAFLYPSPVVDYAHVYNQNYYYPVPEAAPYSVGYSQYVYPQFHVASTEQFNGDTPSLPVNQDGLIPAEFQLQDPAVFAPYTYQNIINSMGYGQLMPMTSIGSFSPGEFLSGFNVGPLPQDMPNHASLEPPVLVPHLEVPKSSIDGDEPKIEMQQSGINNDSGLDSTWNGSGADLQKADCKVSTADGKKHPGKQFGFLYGPAMHLKGSWVQSPTLNFVDSARSMKNSSDLKVKGHAKCTANVEPLTEGELNLENILVDLKDAKHFIIKSFSEENVYRSIQHSVWASTPNGNRKLDEAYKDAQMRAIGKSKGCPVFLYFSVNGSGRFCGVAEMVGPVDYDNTMDFWERNRWCGSFPVKWHLIKDVPHCQLRRIILQNNENKPVTSSRDTQEVNHEQGLQMLNIIRNYTTKSSILDNFPALPKVIVEAKLESASIKNVDGQNVAVVDSCKFHQETHTVAVENGNALRASNGEVKSRELYGQVKPKNDTTNQSPIVEGARKADKENLMLSKISSTVVA
ncbi:hypothetical protein KP509_38G056000 [Ceratopteris richardii]|uniref:YTH domain-containing protein n=1 Tax=Ceratopteris richardii TaxID=49495 RepID=A0A8T2Q636_CERRI|nr:hypothetical protein KP509_38G056000 [Ceratopteris richardii]